MKKFQRIPGESKKEYFNRIDQEATQEVAEALKASRKMRDARKKWVIFPFLCKCALCFTRV